MYDNTGEDHPYPRDELAPLYALGRPAGPGDRARPARPGDRARPAGPGNPARPAQRGRGRRGHVWARTAAIVIAIVVLAGGAVYGWLHVRSRWSAGDGNGAQAARSGPARQAAPDGQPSGPPSNPFAGSPANGYADGQAGIVIPAAHAVGRYTAAQVRDAYQTVKKLLVASQLDPKTLAGGAPDAYANLLIPLQRAVFLSNLNKTGLTSQGYLRSTRGSVAAFAPGTTRLIGHTIKVHGTMSAQSATLAGRPVLRINVSELFVYPVAPPHHPADWMRVVGHDQGQVDFGHFTRTDGALQPYVLLSPFFAGTRCGIYDGYIHPAFPSGPPPKVAPSGAPVNPYSLATAPPSHGCKHISGT